MTVENISFSDRIVSAGSYITGGLIGVIWQVICAVRRKAVSRFLIFNIFQSVFLSLFIFILNLLLSFTVRLLIMIPIINKITNMVILTLFSPVYYGWSIIGFIILTIYVYLSLCSLAGKYPYLPWVSKIITDNINRY